MKFSWRPDMLSEAARQIVFALMAFGILKWSTDQAGIFLMAGSAVLAYITASLTIPVSTVEQAGTSKTQLQAAADANTLAGTPGGTGSPNLPGGAGGPAAPRGLGNFSDKGARGLLLMLALIPALALSACGGKPVILVAQTGQTLAGAIGQAQRATSSLMEGGVITPAQARAVHVKLLQANDKLKPLPDILLAVDAATQAGQSDAGRIDAALAILKAVGVDLDSVVAGLPVGETAGQVLKAVTEARKLVAQITAALAKTRAGLSPPAAAALAGGAR